ncbi:MAG: histidine phosphatase family protein [Pseudomonadota bacterium]
MIYLIRHGEAAASWGSHPDPGLSDAGRMQADAVAQALLSEPISRAITSPMARCQETASYFADASRLELTIQPAVTEIPTPSDVTDRVPWLRGLMSGQWSDVPDLVKDWRNGLIDTLKALPDQTIVFTHFVAVNAIVGSIEGTGNVTVFRPNYCSVTKLDNTSGALRLVERGQSLETKVL